MAEEVTSKNGFVVGLALGRLQMAGLDVAPVMQGVNYTDTIAWVMDGLNGERILVDLKVIVDE